MRKHGIVPLVALSEKYNGWVHCNVLDAFVCFSNVCFDRYKDLVRYWLTFNEIDSIHRHPFTTAGIREEKSATLNDVVFTSLCSPTIWLFSNCPQNRTGTHRRLLSGTAETLS
ncbi:hypothetical protein KP17_18945 [Pectobacterium parvum]|nr:hypothetical protein KP17_18945 [Pectobacterium parvum]GKW41418.1 hypothetical protein PEC301879_12770 [Pectobacterium carotovorum subsp. carotovorum]